MKFLLLMELPKRLRTIIFCLYSKNCKVIFTPFYSFAAFSNLFKLKPKANFVN